MDLSGGRVSCRFGFLSPRHCPGPDPGLSSPPGREHQESRSRSATRSPPAAPQAQARSTLRWAESPCISADSADSAQSRLAHGRSPVRAQPGRGCRALRLPAVLHSVLQRGLSSEHQTGTFASHLPAPIWWPFKKPSLSQRHSGLMHSSSAALMPACWMRCPDCDAGGFTGPAAGIREEEVAWGSRGSRGALLLGPPLRRAPWSQQRPTAVPPAHGPVPTVEQERPGQAICSPSRCGGRKCTGKVLG